MECEGSVECEGRGVCVEGGSVWEGHVCSINNWLQST